MANKYKIVLAAGDIRENGSINELTPHTSLLPICGKPAIYWSLSTFKDLDNCIVVISQDNKKLKLYLNSIFPQIKLICVKSKSVLESLRYALLEIDTDSNVEVLLADTYIKKLPAENGDFSLYSKNISDSKRWCLIETNENNEIEDFIDKQNLSNKSYNKALVGFYSFSSTKLLLNCISESILNGKKQLSSAFSLYIKDRKIKAFESSKWLDFGHTKGLQEARYEFLNSSAREFNSIRLIENYGILDKSSTHKSKLYNEFLWYNSMPEKLKLLSPRIIDFKEYEEYSKLSMEFYGYLNLSELFVYGNPTFEEWSKIIDSLFSLHKLLEEYKPKESPCFKEIYLEKSKDRISSLKKSALSEILLSENIIINNKSYKNYPLLEKEIFKKIEKLLLSNNKATIIHGDYCLSNILFDQKFRLFKLIDPRGSFYDVGIYGDPRYDIAKLRHSIVGLYDFIVARLFSLEELSKNEYIFKINDDFNNEKLASYFDENLVKNGFNLEEIKLIEALLFLTMIPLHSDSLKRQKAFYLTAIKKFNEII